MVHGENKNKKVLRVGGFTLPVCDGSLSAAMTGKA